MRFEHALQAARGFGVGPADTHLADEAVRGLERAKWRLWHGRWPGCRRKLAALCRPELTERPSGTHKEILQIDQWDNANQVISDIRLWLCQRDQIRPIFYTANPVGMRN